VDSTAFGLAPRWWQPTAPSDCSPPSTDIRNVASGGVTLFIAEIDH
jgi:hypothetical protein